MVIFFTTNNFKSQKSFRIRRIRYLNEFKDNIYQYIIAQANLCRTSYLSQDLYLSMIVSSLLKFCVLWGKVVLANKQTKTLYKLNSNKTMNSVKRLLILKNLTKKIKNSIEPFKSLQTLYLCHNLHFMIQGFVRSFITKSTFIYNSCWPLIHKHSYSMIIKEEG